MDALAARRHGLTKWEIFSDSSIHLRALTAINPCGVCVWNLEPNGESNESAWAATLFSSNEALEKHPHRPLRSVYKWYLLNLGSLPMVVSELHNF